jgi:ATP/maltotriose-dependent transcriptional regulator MalT
VAEVVSKQTPEIKAFLLKTSILDRFCAPLLRVLCSPGSGEQNTENDIDPQLVIDWLV